MSADLETRIFRLETDVAELKKETANQSAALERIEANTRLAVEISRDAQAILRFFKWASGIILAAWAAYTQWKGVE